MYKLLITCLSVLMQLSLLGQMNHSDEFEDAGSLDNWKRFYKEEGWPDMMKSIDIADGFLVMEPYTCGWYADYHAPFIFKEIQGDFTVHARLKISGVSSPKPQTAWSLSGLMIRTPREVIPSTWKPMGENWIFLTTGYAIDSRNPVFETKTTINSKSELQLHPARREWVELRIKREGHVFTLYSKYDDGDWKELERFERLDMPAMVQVGLNAYTDFYSAGQELMNDVKKYNTTVVKYGNPDLLVKVDFIRFY